MRIAVIALFALATPLSAVQANSETKSEAAAPSPSYNSTDTEIGVLLDDPAAKAILEKIFPGMTTNPQIDMARGMTMKMIQQYNPDEITDAKLAKLDEELAKLKK